MALPLEKTHTIEDIYALPDGIRAELIDGQIYNMAPPGTKHQILVSRLTQKIANYIDEKGGTCKVIPAPFAVFLDDDNKTYVEPDISVICDKDKLDDFGCNGAPDWVIEIVSPSSERMDYDTKLYKYRFAGVREYWIINPRTLCVNVYDFESNEKTGQYRFDDDIPVCIYKDLSIHLAHLYER